MKQRCNNPHNAFFYRYGGRGISYIEEWEHFEPFMEWALSHGYNDQLTLDRVNNDGNYSPENCKWSSQAEQSANKEHKKNRLGYVGVKERFYKGKASYTASVMRNHKSYYIGIFRTSLEASIARELFIKERFCRDNN